MVVQLIEWLFIWLNCCSSGWMVVRLVGWLLCWSNGCSFGCMVATLPLIISVAKRWVAFVCLWRATCSRFISMPDLTRLKALTKLFLFTFVFQRTVRSVSTSNMWHNLHRARHFIMTSQCLRKPPATSFSVDYYWLSLAEKRIVCPVLFVHAERVTQKYKKLCECERLLQCQLCSISCTQYFVAKPEMICRNVRRRFKHFQCRSMRIYILLIITLDNVCFRWDISVACIIIVLKLAVTAFTSLCFRTL